MARNETRRLKSAIIQADENGFAALQAMTAYAPANAVYALDTISAAHRDVNSLRDEEARAVAAAAAARESAVAKEWEFHNLMLGAKAQVIAQFGVDSNEVQLLGLKKKSEYKTPGRKVHQQAVRK
jgi:hypothetical protein